MSPRRTTLLAVVALLLTAGCVQFGGPSGTATTVPTATATETPRTSTETPRQSTETPPSSTETPTPTETERPTATTTEPVGTGRPDFDLTVRNSREETVTTNVTVVENATGDRILAREVTLDHRESVDYAVPFPAPGNYTVRATVNATDGDFHTSDRYVWEVERLPPSFVLDVTARPDGNVTFTGVSPHLFAGRGRSQ